MNRQEFEAIIDDIKKEVPSLPEVFRKEDVGPEVIWIRSANESFTYVNYVDLRTITFFESYCKFEVIPESGWEDGIESRSMLIPYSSIVAIEQTDHNYDGQPYSTYELILVSDYGKVRQVDWQYLPKRDGTYPDHIKYSPTSYLAQILREVRELNMRDSSTIHSKSNGQKK